MLSSKVSDDRQCELALIIMQHHDDEVSITVIMLLYFHSHCWFNRYGKLKRKIEKRDGKRVSWLSLSDGGDALGGAGHTHSTLTPQGHGVGVVRIHAG